MAFVEEGEEEEKENLRHFWKEEEKFEQVVKKKSLLEGHCELGSW